MVSDGLQIERLFVRLGDRVVLDNVSLAVESGTITCVTGPSGSGKSTLLRAIAGLVPVEQGDIRLDGVSLLGVATHRRGVGMVFQDHALFPHLSVADNIAFGLRMLRTPKRVRHDRVAELLGLIGLAAYSARPVATLSGGEQQRVALARSLAPQPKVLLLDEPLSALDPELHDRLATDLRRVLREVRATAIHVTHDRAEAALVGDRTVDLRGL